MDQQKRKPPEEKSGWNLRDIISNIIPPLFLRRDEVRQTIFKNISWLVFGEFLSRFLKLVFIIYAARVLGVADYGKLTFALSFVFLFIIISDFGLSAIITREFSKNSKKKEEYSAIISLKIILSFVTLFLILFCGMVITNDLAIKKLILILAFYIIAYGFNEIIYAFFRAYQKMKYEALAKIFQSLFFILAGLLVFLKFPSVENIAYIYSIGALMGSFFILLSFHYKILPLKLSWEKSIWKKFLGMSWLLALPQISGMIYFYIDSTMLGYWGKITENGWYSASYKIIDIMIIPAALISQGFYPVLSNFFENSKEKIQYFWNLYMQSMFFLAIPLVAGGIIIAPKLIDFVYGKDFIPSILSLQILIFMAGLVFIYNPFYRMMIIANRQKMIFGIILLGIFTNILLNFFLVGKFDFYGIAWATVITHAIILILMFFFTKKYTSIIPVNFKLFKTLLFALAAAFVMCLAIKELLAREINFVLVAIIALFCYIFLFFAMFQSGKLLKRPSL